MNIDIDNAITLFGYIISAFVGYKVSKMPSRNTVELESVKIQFHSVYLPLFKAFESNLYKKIDNETAISYIELFKTIKSNYYEYIDSSLVSLFNDFEKEIPSGILSNYYFSSICYIVDKQYEKLKKKLYLPKRSFLYKFSHKQLPKDTLNSIKYFFDIISKFIYAVYLIGFPVYIALFVYKITRLILSLFIQ